MSTREPIQLVGWRDAHTHMRNASYRMTHEDAVNTWREAYDAQVRRIEQHPDFGRLIREVAITEQPDVRHSKAYRNSPTFGSWMIRTGAPRILRRRAVYFMAKIARELGTPQGWAERDFEGMIWARAALAARARQRSGVGP